MNLDIAYGIVKTLDEFKVKVGRYQILDYMVVRKTNIIYPDQTSTAFLSLRTEGKNFEFSYTGKWNELAMLDGKWVSCGPLEEGVNLVSREQ